MRTHVTDWKPLVPADRDTIAQFNDARAALAAVRTKFKNLSTLMVVQGGDNHIGDIGEFWVARYYQLLKRKPRLAPAKNSPYDLRLEDETLVAVRTVTPWATRGAGMPVRPFDKDGNKKWRVFVAVRLDEQLAPVAISEVPLEALMRTPTFARNARNRDNGSKAWPAFRWWRFLDTYRASETTIAKLRRDLLIR